VEGLVAAAVLGVVQEAQAEGSEPAEALAGREEDSVVLEAPVVRALEVAGALAAVRVAAGEPLD
jgi:hypothetical protein